MKTLQAIRGMNDILPTDVGFWQWVQHCFQQLAESYGYREIRTPVLEMTALFTHSIGDASDIVTKEMYTFTDRNGDSLSLRPEGTASCVRAGIEHGLLHRQTQRLWYFAPMFRHERPQKGRYRQFHQFGLEAYGFNGPDIDAEVILFCAAFWQRLGLTELRLELNNIGTVAERQQYRQQLIDYFNDHRSQLDEDSLQRLVKNPLRILDSKNPAMQQLIKQAPTIEQHLSAESADHFAGLKAILDEAKLEYDINPQLVRGLDYYTGTVFEWVTTELGAQATVCAGGRYNDLVADHGGPSTPSVGFGCGVERLILLLQQQDAISDRINRSQLPHVYFIMVGDAALTKGMCLAQTWRQQIPNLRLINHCGGGSFKSQMKKADKSGAQVALIIGDDELQNNVITYKPLRDGKPQTHLSMEQLLSELQRLVTGEV